MMTSRTIRTLLFLSQFNFRFVCSFGRVILVGGTSSQSLFLPSDHSFLDGESPPFPSFSDQNTPQPIHDGNGRVTYMVGSFTIRVRL